MLTNQPCGYALEKNVVVAPGTPPQGWHDVQIAARLLASRFTPPRQAAMKQSVKMIVGNWKMNGLAGALDEARAIAEAAKSVDAPVASPCVRPRRWSSAWRLC